MAPDLLGYCIDYEKRLNGISWVAIDPHLTWPSARSPAEELTSNLFVVCDLITIDVDTSHTLKLEANLKL